MDNGICYQSPCRSPYGNSPLSQLVADLNTCCVHPTPGLSLPIRPASRNTSPLWRGGKGTFPFSLLTMAGYCILVPRFVASSLVDNLINNRLSKIQQHLQEMLPTHPPCHAFHPFRPSSPCTVPCNPPRPQATTRSPVLASPTKTETWEPRDRTRRPALRTEHQIYHHISAQDLSYTPPSTSQGFSHTTRCCT